MTEESCQRKILHYLNYITVEPTLILYMMAFMTTSVIEEDFFIYKACHINHNYNHTICSNRSSIDYKNVEKEIQITVSNFHYINDIAGHAGQIILALFLGAWSDKRGRKLPLLIGSFSKLYYSIMIVINTLTNWPIEYIVYTATLPMAFSGGDVAIFAAAFTYLIDVSSENYRTIRVTLLEVCYLATMPLGIALGSYLFSSVVNRSYTIMFIINCILMVISIIYSFIRLKWQTNDKQRPLSEAPNIFKDFFDYNHVLNTIKTLTKKRNFNGRIYLLILLTMMGLYTFQRDERRMSYLYLQLVFNWNVEQYSLFRTVQSALQDVGLLVAIPLMSKVFGLRDGIIVMVGAMAHTIARIFFAYAKVSWVFYLGGGFAAFGPIVAPVIRSMVSKLVAPSEKGKTFSVLSVADNAIPLISGICYSKLYNATIDYAPNSIFFLTMATQLTVLLLMLIIHSTSKDENLVHREVESLVEA